MDKSLKKRIRSEVRNGLSRLFNRPSEIRTAD
nr:MAG TPA: hypothetical protein [Caudoviricetes sp.]